MKILTIKLWITNEGNKVSILGGSLCIKYYLVDTRWVMTGKCNNNTPFDVENDALADLRQLNTSSPQSSWRARVCRKKLKQKNDQISMFFCSLCIVKRQRIALRGRGRWNKTKSLNIPIHMRDGYEVGIYK